LAVVAAASATCASAKGRAASARPTVIALDPYLGQLWSFQAEAAGRPRRFLLDTAGGLTVITRALAKDMACEPWGQLTGFRMRGDRLDVPRCDGFEIKAQGADLAAPTVGVLDLSALLPKDAPPLDGSVALDSFAGRVITLDLAARKLVLETPASLKQRVRAARETPVRFSREAGGLALTPLAAVETARGRIWMELDCGSDGSVIVGRQVAELLGLNRETKGAQPLSLRLAGGVAVESQASVQDLILDGNIGAPVLSQWIITIDLANQRMWLARSRKPPQ
jgi:hypothetical protein